MYRIEWPYFKWLPNSTRTATWECESVLEHAKWPLRSRRGYHQKQQDFDTKATTPGSTWILTFRSSRSKWYDFKRTTKIILARLRLTTPTDKITMQRLQRGHPFKRSRANDKSPTPNVPFWTNGHRFLRSQRISLLDLCRPIYGLGRDKFNVKRKSIYCL